jgi:hypothetical protein
VDDDLLGRALCFAQALHDCRITVIEETAGFGIQRCNRRHIVRTQVEIEDSEVFRDAFWAHRFRNRDNAALCQPAQNDLRHSFLALDCDGTQHLVLEHVVLAFRKWPPGLNLHIVFLQELLGWVSIC